MTYSFNYDSLGCKTSVKVGSQTLSTNVYANNRNALLSEVQYGNGGKVKYTYDDFDRITGIRYDNQTSDRFSYSYAANGQAAVVRDHALNRAYHTDYDLAERPMGSLLLASDGAALQRTRLSYDKRNRLTAFGEALPSAVYLTSYAYDNDDRTTSISFDGDTHKITYTYDNLGRVSSRVALCGSDAGKVTSSYSYLDGAYGENSTSSVVSAISQTGISYEYTYDSRGNIVSEKRGDLTTTYAYDAIGQLIRVNDPHENATWVYDYDRGGNILSKKKNAYTTGTVGAALETIPYVYGDSNWKDKLTGDKVQ